MQLSLQNYLLHFDCSRYFISFLNNFDQSTKIHSNDKRSTKAKRIGFEVKFSASKRNQKQPKKNDFNCCFKYLKPASVSTRLWVWAHINHISVRSKTCISKIETCSMSFAWTHSREFLNGRHNKHREREVSWHSVGHFATRKPFIAILTWQYQIQVNKFNELIWPNMNCLFHRRPKCSGRNDGKKKR